MVKQFLQTVVRPNLCHLPSTIHLYKMCHIPFTFNDYDAIIISEGGENSGGVTGDMAAKLVTAVQVCVFFNFYVPHH